VTSINVSAEPKPMNDSIVKTSTGEYVSDVFDKDLAEARAKADKIVKDNLVATPDGGDSCSALTQP
jgi:membrane fusion protein (multidrug efflux system)